MMASDPAALLVVGEDARATTGAATSRRKAKPLSAPVRAQRRHRPCFHCRACGKRERAGDYGLYFDSHMTLDVFSRKMIR